MGRQGFSRPEEGRILSDITVTGENNALTSNCFASFFLQFLLFSMMGYTSDQLGSAVPAALSPSSLCTPRLLTSGQRGRKGFDI